MIEARAKIIITTQIFQKMMKSRREVVIKQKLTKIFFTLIVSFSLSSAYAADPKIPTVDDVNREIPNVKKDLKKNEMPSDALIDKDKKKVDQVKEEDVTKVFVKSFIIRGNKKYPTE